MSGHGLEDRLEEDALQVGQALGSRYGRSNAAGRGGDLVPVGGHEVRVGRVRKGNGHRARLGSRSGQSAPVVTVGTGCPLAVRVTSMFPRVALE